MDSASGVADGILQFVFHQLRVLPQIPGSDCDCLMDRSQAVVRDSWDDFLGSGVDPGARPDGYTSCG